MKKLNYIYTKGAFSFVVEQIEARGREEYLPIQFVQREREREIRFEESSRS